MERRLAPPAHVLRDDHALDSWMKREVVTAHHVSSTCKMGTADDAMAVVDQYGRVHGVECLRVIDASIMPDTVRANLNLTVIAMAERGADFIKFTPILAFPRRGGRDFERLFTSREGICEIVIRN